MSARKSRIMKNEDTAISQTANGKPVMGAGAESKDQEVEVLYQNLGGKWYAFSLVDDEVFVGSIEQEMIETKAKLES